MKPTSSHAQSRADSLWRHFVGIFGGESVERRFGKAPPPEWVSEIGGLKDYELERGMRRLLKSGSMGVPSLPQFTKFCRTIDDDDRPTDAPRIADQTLWDPWVVAANTHLLAHIAKQSEKGIHYVGVELTGCLVRHKNSWAADMRDWGSEPTVEEQKTHWRWHMACADAEAKLIRDQP
jgi:hypothetical protein